MPTLAVHAVNHERVDAAPQLQSRQHKSMFEVPGGLHAALHRGSWGQAQGPRAINLLACPGARCAGTPVACSPPPAPQPPRTPAAATLRPHAGAHLGDGESGVGESGGAELGEGGREQVAGEVQSPGGNHCAVAAVDDVAGAGLGAEGPSQEERAGKGWEEGLYHLCRHCGAQGGTQGERPAVRY